MIELGAAIFQFTMFGIWKMDNGFNLVIKIIFLIMGLALSFEALREFGFIVQLPNH